MLFGSILNNCKITERKTGPIKLQLYIRASFCKGFSSSCPNFLPPDFIYFFSLPASPLFSALPPCYFFPSILHHCCLHLLPFILSNLYLFPLTFSVPLPNPPPSFRLYVSLCFCPFHSSLHPSHFPLPSSSIPLPFLSPPSTSRLPALPPRLCCDTVIITALAIEIWWGRARAVGCRWGTRWEGGVRGALSGRHGRRLPWKQRDSASEGWRDSGGVDWV